MNLIRNTDGNFAMIASIMLPVVFVAGSLALDTTNAMSMKTQLQNAADSAALATASQLSNEQITQAEAEDYAKAFFASQISGDSESAAAFSATPTVTISSTGVGARTIWTVKVVAAGSQDLSRLARFMGKDTINVNISGTSESSKSGSGFNPLSMALVLDRSGSMRENSGQTVEEVVQGYCYNRRSRRYYRCETTQVIDIPKIDVLKEAVGNLTAHIVEADPTNQYARMGAVSYNSSTGYQDKLSIGWTKVDVAAFAASLVADGGTNSEDAMHWAYDQIVSSTEINEHYSKNGSKDPKKFIVFMTDGENSTGSSWRNDYADSQTIKYCDKAKDEGVTIFAVAFQAPDRGEELLSACASGDAFYYDADSAEALLAAFESIGEAALAQATRLTN
ncbi:vWA domain-containing protein [Hoeflea ulvae]|uniref:VWA domain-containing protein n=1 Tax=Hoeflea ulvae TaxID=2983764 RepID=A0ABT3YEJ6_9HYPH|nr:VWA domain-containing protein [Hoeflea ulvae]MCY0094313.1 VWA domain-containing protein [Hoeflea ulvae]